MIDSPCFRHLPKEDKIAEQILKCRPDRIVRAVTHFRLEGRAAWASSGSKTVDECKPAVSGRERLAAPRATTRQGHKGREF